MLVIPTRWRNLLFCCQLVPPRPLCSWHVAGGATCGWHVALHGVVHYHAVGVEAPAEGADGAFHALDPAARQAVVVALIVERDYFIAQYVVQSVGILRIVDCHIRVCSSGSN